MARGSGWGRPLVHLGWTWATIDNAGPCIRGSGRRIGGRSFVLSQAESELVHGARFDQIGLDREGRMVRARDAASACRRCIRDKDSGR